MDYKTYIASLAKRRKEIKTLRSQDPKKWTWRRLGERYNITPQRAQQVGTSE